MILETYLKSDERRRLWYKCSHREVAKSHLWKQVAPDHSAHLGDYSEYLYEASMECDVCGVLHHNESGMCSQHEAAAELAYELRLCGITGALIRNCACGQHE